MAAALATIQAIKTENTIDHIWQIGSILQTRFNDMAESLNMLDYIKMEGYPCSPYLIIKDDNLNPSLQYRTLFLQETIKDRILIPWIALSHAHGEAEISQTLNASYNALEVHKIALDTGNIDSMIQGPIVKPVFRAYN